MTLHADLAPAFRRRRVLVTGATGFLGSHLVRRLVGCGAHVFALVRAGTSLERVADVKSALTLLVGDIRHRGSVEEAVAAAQPEIVFHLGAYGVDPRREGDAQTAVETNVVGLLNLLESTRDVPYRRLVNTGTCFEYGGHPGAVAETAPVDPLNVYAASKTAALHFCTVHARAYAKPIVTLRPFTFFGPWERRDRLVPSVILAALAGRPVQITSGMQTRDYTYVDDMVDGFLAAAVREEAIGQVINLGSGVERSVRDIAERIVSLMGARVAVQLGAMPDRPQEAWRLRADASRACELLGWVPRVSFEDGLGRTVEWFRNHGDLVAEAAV